MTIGAYEKPRRSLGPSARTNEPVPRDSEAGLYVDDIAMTPLAILDRDDIELDKNEKHAAIAPRSAFAEREFARDLRHDRSSPIFGGSRAARL